MATKTASGLSGIAAIDRDLAKAVKGFNDLNKSVANLKAVKSVRKKSKYKGGRSRNSTTRRYVTVQQMVRYRTTGLAEFDTAMRYILEDATQTLKGKARTWAVETLQMMKGLSPLRTENLMESIKIRSNDKNLSGAGLSILDANGMVYAVGIDEQAILPPPARKRIKHGPRKGAMVTMSNFNYAVAADKAIKKLKTNGYQGYDFLRRWQQAAKENMERIFR